MNTLNSLKTFLSRGGNPKQILEGLAISNPLVKNLIGLANKGQSQDIETFARNLFREKGRDFDKEFSEFQNRLK